MIDYSRLIAMGNAKMFSFVVLQLSYSFVDSSEDPMPIIRQVNYSTGFSSTNLQGIFCK